jgi:transposase InsO family protein
MGRRADLSSAAGRARRLRRGGEPRAGRPDGLVHYSDRGLRYLAVRYTERLSEAGRVTCVGSQGNGCDNAWPSPSTAWTRPN